MGAQEKVSFLQDTLSLSKPYLNISLQVLPFGVASFVACAADQTMYDTRQNHIPDFRYHYDDYLQYLPLAAQLSMGVTGVQGRSDNLLHLLTADAFAGALSAIFVNGIKYSVGRLRPDYSARNSFPSGHTATAFLGAELFDLEYGNRYPYLSAVTYSMAVVTGISRVLNNRHWLTDVFAGAGVGILSAQMGYWLSDIIYQRPLDKATFFVNWQELTPFALTYQGSSGTLFSRQSGCVSTVRSSLSFSYLYDRDSASLGSLGATAGFFTHKTNVREPSLFFGLETVRSYLMLKRLACGFSIYWNFLSPWGEVQMDFVSELGSRFFFDYYFLPHRSMRFFGGLSGAWGVQPLCNNSAILNTKTPFYLLLELGIALQLHLF